MKHRKTFYALRCALISRTIRALTDLNQKEFADNLGLTRTTITSIEGLEKTPRATVLMDLMELGAKHGIDFCFRDDGMEIFMSNEGAYALLEKLDPFQLEPFEKPELPVT
jgi:transcriptional regulator with XRE-family HTH domain